MFSYMYQYGSCGGDDEVVFLFLLYVCLLSLFVIFVCYLCLVYLYECVFVFV